MICRFALAMIFLMGLTASCLHDTPAIPVYGYEVVETFPHDPAAFTQGLVFHDGYLYEGTGLYGRSSLRQVDLETGEVLRHCQLPDHNFGEGVTLWDDKLVQLTWRANLGFVWGIENFTLVRTFTYSTHGWGLTHDGEHLIMSDGSSALYLLDPHTFEPTGQIQVRYNGVPVDGLNELEYINGRIFANVWTSDRIAIISPGTGTVAGWIDLTGLLNDEERARAGVLNGIAYDPANDRILVTGKLWPKTFHIKPVAER